MMLLLLNVHDDDDDADRALSPSSHIPFVYIGIVVIPLEVTAALDAFVVYIFV